MSLNPNGAPAGYYYQAGATAYLIDPAGTYSLAGASAPTIDPAGTVQRRGRERPHARRGGRLYSDHRGDLRCGGDCRPCGRLQSGGRERADDRSGRHSTAARARARPRSPRPGAYIPITGATSAAAEIVDPAGTYSRRARARRRPIRPAGAAPPAQRADAGGGGRVYSSRPGRPPPRRRLSTLPALTVWRARARRRPIRPAGTAPPAPARRRSRPRALTFQ